MIWRWKAGGPGMPRGRVHCRHCLKPFERRRLGVACRSERCRHVPDETGLRGPRFFFADERQLWRDGELDLDERPCPFCDAVDTLESVCPHCRQPLGLDQGEDQVLAVIGASASGKSHFLAAVLHQLLDGGVGGGVWRVDLPGSKLRAFRKRYLAPLFDELRVLPATPRRLDDELRLPLVDDVHGRRVLLVFRDLSGEVFLDPESLARLFFLRYARGVVLTADPLAFEPPPEGLEPDEGAPSPWKPTNQPDALHILEVYRRVLEARERHADDGELLLRPEDKYLAVAVTKADLVLPPGHRFWRDGTGAGGGHGVDEHLEPGYWERLREHSAEVAEWVGRWLDPGLVREAGAFAGVRWFFTSSIGYPLPPGHRVLPETPRPRRVHEPIFALLDRLTGGEELEPLAAAPARETSAGGPQTAAEGTGGEAEEASPAPPRRRRPVAADDEDWGL